MSVDPHPYSSYRDTNVPWLGPIPEHWRLLPGRACYRQKMVSNTGLRETTVLSLSFGQIVIKPPEKLHGLVPTSFDTYQIVDPGDIVIRPTDLQNDWNSLRFGISRYRGIITSAYLCFVTSEVLIPEYGHLLLHTYDLKKVFYGLGSGLRQNLDWSDFKYLPCVVPPPQEQLAIIRFFRKVDHRINCLIRAKRQMVLLLTEQKQAIIQEFVTRGLDPTALTKRTSLPLVNVIPKHWEVKRLRSLVRSVEQGVSPQAEARLADDGAWGVLKAGCVNRGVFRDTEHKRLPDGFRVDPALAVRLGDVLVSRASGSPQLVGSVGKVRELRYKLILSDKTFRLVFHDERIADFAVAAMNTPYYRNQVEQAISGAEGLASNLPLSKLKDFVLAIPPPEEAQRVAHTLDRVLRRQEQLIERAQREIELVLEYRTRLVADAVTGKLDVRTAAFALPNVHDLAVIDSDILDDQLSLDADNEVGDEA